MGVNQYKKLFLIFVLITVCLSACKPALPPDPPGTVEPTAAPEVYIHGVLGVKQEKAIDGLAAKAVDSVEVYAQEGIITALLPASARSEGASAADQVNNFMLEQEDLFDIQNFSDQFILRSQKEKTFHESILSYEQVISGIPVLSSNLVFSLGQEAEVKLVSGQYLPSSRFTKQLRPQTKPEQLASYFSGYGIEPALAEAAELVIFYPPIFGQEGPAELAWQIQDTASTLIISDLGGQVLGEFNHIYTADIVIRDFEDKARTRKQSSEELKAKKQRYAVGKFTNETKELRQTVERFDTLLDKYQNLFGLANYDGLGTTLDVFINVKYGSSFYSSYPFPAVYLKTDDHYFTTIVHEFQHAVTEQKVRLDPSKLTPQAGAINEGVSDFMTALFADGENRWTIRNFGRDMSGDKRVLQAGVISSPYHMNDYYTKEKIESFISKLFLKDEIDYGFGHFNSTIISHALFLIAAQETVRGVKFNGIGPELTAKMVMATLDKLPDHADFTQFYATMVSVCQAMQGSKQVEESACTRVRRAFYLVGIGRPVDTEDLKAPLSPTAVPTPLPSPTAKDIREIAINVRALQNQQSNGSFRYDANKWEPIDTESTLGFFLKLKANEDCQIMPDGNWDGGEPYRIEQETQTIGRTAFSSMKVIYGERFVERIHVGWEDFYSVALMMANDPVCETEFWEVIRLSEEISFGLTEQPGSATTKTVDIGLPRLGGGKVFLSYDPALWTPWYFGNTFKELVSINEANCKAWMIFGGCRDESRFSTIEQNIKLGEKNYTERICTEQATGSVYSYAIQAEFEGEPYFFFVESGRPMEGPITDQCIADFRELIRVSDEHQFLPD